MVFVFLSTLHLTKTFCQVVITDAVELLYQEGEGGVPAINPAEVGRGLRFDPGISPLS